MRPLCVRPLSIHVLLDWYLPLDETDKETWEPIIQALLALDQHRHINDIWALDWQHHGDSVKLNEDALRNRPEGISTSCHSLSLFKAVLNRVLFSRLHGVGSCVSTIHGFEVSERSPGGRYRPLSWGLGRVRLIHASRTCCKKRNSLFFFSMSSAKYFHQPRPLSPSHFDSISASEWCIPYAFIILVDPTLVDRQLYNAHLEERERQVNHVIAAVSKGRTTWESREEAFTWFSKNHPWKKWDERVVRLFVVRTLVADLFILREPELTMLCMVRCRSMVFARPRMQTVMSISRRNARNNTKLGLTTTPRIPSQLPI